LGVLVGVPGGWGRGGGGGVEGRVADAVAVDFADVEVGADGAGVGGGDVVGGAPDFFAGGVVVLWRWVSEGWELG